MPKPKRKQESPLAQGKQQEANSEVWAPSAPTETPVIRWGVLGAARIATRKVIPAMQCGAMTKVTAIASRDTARARQSAGELGIEKTYGSYEELIDDPDVDAIYNPLPNHLHVPWTIRAAEAGKHVLCEKPIALTSADIERLIEVRDRTGVLIQEAFMVRSHPRWLRVLDLVESGRIGSLRAMMGFFSYFNDDATNIRNIPDFGGGAILDVGCYLISTARMIFDAEPLRVVTAIDRDPALKVDRLSSILLDFGSGHALGTCSTQLVPAQRMTVFGTDGRLELELPFNAPPDRPTEIVLDPGTDLLGAGIERIEIDVCDQYTIQGDLFSLAIRRNATAPYPLEDSLNNMRVIEAAFRSAESGGWETV
jgi:predicted dehydrogenase